MTLDNTPDTTSSSNGQDAAPAKKPARRRVTRTTAAPGTPDAPSAAQITLPAVTSPAQPPAANPSAPTGSLGIELPTAEAAPRRSRRVVRPTTTPVEAPAAPATAEPVAEKAPAQEPVVEKPAAEKAVSAPAVQDAPPAAPRRGGKRGAAARAAADAPVLDVLSELGLAPAAEQDAPAEKPARARRTRKPAAEAAVTEAVTPVEPPAPEVTAPTEPDAPTEPAAPRAATRRRATRSSAVEAAPVEAPAAVEEPAEAAPVEKAPAKRRRATSKTATTAAPAEAVAPVSEAPAAEAPAEPAAPKVRSRRVNKVSAAQAAQAAAAPEAPATESAPAPSTASTGGGSATPRLATTALLFQAPDPAAAPRRSRRVVRPTTSPFAADAMPSFATPTARTPEEPAAPAEAPAARVEPARRAPVAEQAPEPAVEQRTEAPARTRGGRGRSARRGAGAPASAGSTAAPTTQPAAEAAPVAAPEVAPAAAEIVLVGADLAAVEEIELIEAELVAEGVEIPADALELDDLDLVVEGDDVAELAPASDVEEDDAPRRRRRRGGRGRRSRGGESRADGTEGSDGDEYGDDESSHEQQASSTDATDAAEPSVEAEDQHDEHTDEHDGEEGAGSSRRRRRRRRGGRPESGDSAGVTVTTSSSSRTRTRERSSSVSDEVTALKGSTRLEAKRQRRREGRDAGRRRQIITEAEFLARRESVERAMVVREKNGRTQIAVLEDGVLVEHYVSQQSQVSMAGNVYLGRVQNVLPSMEAAFIDVGKGRNAVLYAGEVNWDAVGLDGQPRRIEQALKSGDSVLVQVTKDPIGHKGARLTSQITLAGRYLVFVPGGGMTGISRKLPDTERARLKKILREIVPEGSGVIVRTAAEGASEDELRADVERLQGQWEAIEKKSKSASAPALLQGEPDLAIRVVRDIFNDDFSSLVVSGDNAWNEISSYVAELAPDLKERVSRWTSEKDAFSAHRVDEQLAKGMDRKVWLPSGGSLVIDRTEAMTVVDVNTGKFTGSGGTLEETVTRNNLEAAEEIVRQLRLRDIGGIIVIDFIDMVLESNRDLVLRRLVECLGRDRTKHQVAEVTSLGLVQMTRKRVGQGLVEAFSETCDHCNGRGFIVHTDPIEKSGGSNNGGGQQHQHAPAPAVPAAEEPAAEAEGSRSRSRRKRVTKESTPVAAAPAVPVLPEVTSEAREAVKATLATIAAAAAHAHEHEHDGVAPVEETVTSEVITEAEAETEVVGVETVLTDVEAVQGAPEVADEGQFPVSGAESGAAVEPGTTVEADAEPATAGDEAAGEPAPTAGLNDEETVADDESRDDS
ncbi:ribonuclease E/G [Oerskovia enterophila]|uniref:Ribonuclease G n=1 Tax=Oerskovia enterophila TaxID=43678 RepID=A0ABX2YB28_9CELL|nr:ribonuclease E/G [Oerskovia enterophila]OCI31170.1 ribonuclease G [Oerskovia enterophila]